MSIRSTRTNKSAEVTARLRKFCRGLLITTLGVAVAWGQQQPGVIPTAAEPGSGLKIFVLTGEGGVNRIPLGLAADTVVEVRDHNDLPIVGAEVVFTLPETGTGGSYDGQKQFRTKTDTNGQASTIGFRPTGPAGPFEIQVRATHAGRSGFVVINQLNSPKPIASTYEEPKPRAKRWWIIGGLAAGALVATLLATRDWDSDSNEPITIVLSPGAVTVGGPRP